MPNVYEPLVLEIEPPYIGSAFSPTVDIDETADDITVTITDSRGEHSYTVDKTDQAIADAEAAAANANQAASDVQSAVDAASTAATRANNAASAAETATVDTQSATLAANAAASDAQSATSTANAAASNADAKAALANTAASNADEKAALADDAAENADAKAALADTAATAANTAAADASTAAASANTAAQEATEAAESITDGRFPMMTAGMADALFGDTEMLVTFPHVSQYDGAARIASIHGNTVVQDGSLQSVNVEGIESAGIVREIPPSTLFPDGILRSAGTAYDERTPTRDVKRIGSVDLGTLNWTSRENVNEGFFVVNSGEVLNLYNNQITCSEYEHRERPSGWATWPDKAICVNRGANTSGNANIGAIIIKDLSATGMTAEQFKAHVSGVYANFELATPTTTLIDPPLNMTYTTQRGGTESIVIPTGEQSAPPTMAIVYAYNADGVRDISQAIVANIEGNTASTNYAIGGYFVHAGKLYRATSAIATGETISPGTNCTQTTVMAELVRLTA